MSVVSLIKCFEYFAAVSELSWVAVARDFTVGVSLYLLSCGFWRLRHKRL